MARPPRLQKLTLFLFKEGVTRETVLRSPDSVVGYEVPSLLAGEDSLFVRASSPRPPAWVQFLDPHVGGGLTGLLTASSSAALVFEAGGRLFAATFGQGRYLLDLGRLEYDFGLKVVLNTVAPDQLKSVDAKTIEETTLHKRQDVSRDSSFASFGLDVSRDLLRAVTGTPHDKTLAHRLAGSDSLGLWTRERVPDLQALAGRLLEAYQSDVYKRHFDFVDFLRPEKSAERVQELERLLCAALETGALSDAHVAAPEVLDPLDLDGFRFTSAPDMKYPDPRITAYRDSVEGKNVDVDLLKRDRLTALYSDGNVYREWPVYQCIVYEVTVGDDLFVLTGGDWFRVNVAFREQVIADVTQLSEYAGLPDADSGTDEASYNTKAAETIGGLCLDQKLVYDDGPDRMEICDVLSREGALIHVKQRGASSTLSHLFTQGVNSAERLLQDDEFRRQAHAVIIEEDASFENVLPIERPANVGALEVTFAVITRSTRPTPLTLPFFSVVSLRTAARRLRALGFRVSVAEIHEQS